MLRRWSLFRVAGATLGLVWLIVMVAFVYAATIGKPDLKSIGAAVFALGIAAAGILYAWREPGP